MSAVDDLASSIMFMVEQAVVYKRTSTYSELPIVVMHRDTHAFLLDMAEKQRKRKNKKRKLK
jgi:hypothetical protein